MRDSCTPQSGIHYSMPEIPRVDWVGSPESFTHEFLKNLPMLSRESQERAADRFASVPNKLNAGKMEMFNPISKVLEDSCQSDSDSNGSQVRNPTPLLISKVSTYSGVLENRVYSHLQVPNVLYTGFTNSYLNQYLSPATKDKPHSNEATHDTVEISQVRTVGCISFNSIRCDMMY